MRATARVNGEVTHDKAAGGRDQDPLRMFYEAKERESIRVSEAVFFVHGGGTLKITTHPRTT